MSIRDHVELFYTFLYQHSGTEDLLITPSSLIYPATDEQLSEGIKDVRTVAQTPMLKIPLATTSIFVTKKGRLKW